MADARADTLAGEARLGHLEIAVTACLDERRPPRLLADDIDELVELVGDDPRDRRA